MDTQRITPSAHDWLSFRRIVDIPFGTCVAALESGQLTGHRIGLSLVSGPVEHDRGTGTYRIRVRASRDRLAGYPGREPGGISTRQSTGSPPTSTQYPRYRTLCVPCPCGAASVTSPSAAPPPPKDGMTM
ncbi:MAG TPA: hypothetical protein VGS06_03535 [Streptosporangiaceae bacterium]|nr:hypothetical protein [Streptosporangiaceae bacterium]